MCVAYVHVCVDVHARACLEASGWYPVSYSAILWPYLAQNFHLG